MPAATEEDTHNPRWKGYVYILISSLVNFASLGGLEEDDTNAFGGNFQASLVFGITTFALTVAILVLDRFQYCCSKDDDKFNYTKSMDGKIEGYTLLLFSLWWVVGVAYITQVGGVAYVANNIYFSAWGSLFSCVYTLNKWSASKDILSLRELTGVSATLKSWYVLFLSSLVTMGTSCDLHTHVADFHKSSAVFGIILGLGSTLISLFFIFVHYRIIDYEILQVGGWIELSASFFMILLWIVCVSILTAEGGIAATIGGSGCTSRIAPIYGANNGVDWNNECYVIYVPTQDDDDEEEDDNDNTVKPTLRPQVLDTNTSSTSMPTAIPTESPTIMTLSPTEAAGNMPNFNGTLAPSTSTNTTVNATGSGVDGDFILANNSMLDDSEGNGFSLAPSSLIEAEDLEATEMPSGMDSDVGTVDDTNTTSQLELNGDVEVTAAPQVVELDIGLADDGSNTTSNASIGVDSMVNGGSNTTASNASIAEDANERFLQSLIDSNTTTNTTNNNATVNLTLPTSMPTQYPSISSAPSQFPTGVRYTERTSCSDVLAEQIPGSNLYLACWVCFLASLNITLRWKAAQAIQFAQAQTRKTDERLERAAAGEEDLSNSGNGVAAADDDNDDDRDPDNSYRVEDDNLR